MNRTHRNWKVPVSGALLLATAVSAEQDLQTYLNSTNRVTLSLRFGLNVSGKFKGIAGGSSAFTLPVAGGRRTPNGDPYNYDNGYVLTDITGNDGGMTWYWGYDKSGQVNLANSTISFDRASMASLPDGASGDKDSAQTGAELAYNYEIGMKEDWHQLRYGLEVAINWMPISFKNDGLYGIVRSLQTDTYSFTPGTTPPGYGDSSELPYQGTFQGGNFVLNVPPLSSTTAALPNANFIVQQKFNANLWGIRLGPYLEMPLSERWSLHLSGGLAVGLLDGNVSWNEQLAIPGGPTLTRAGSGDDTKFLCGYYVGLSAAYQFNDRWGLEAGVQFQDLGVYDHNFGGSRVELDLSKSVFVHAGVSFSF
jgi:hypothetical protein